jgi:short subunit dehydrogenase-like uncharacterized protein
VARATDGVLVYGATGFTGRLLVRGLLDAGIEPILCGRSETLVQAMARELRLRARTAALEDVEIISGALRGCQVLLNAAGPFGATASRLVAACLQAGVHYLDVSGEVDAIEGVARMHRQALDAGVMLLPGVGFDVVPSDCLALHVCRRLPDARRLAIAVSGLELMSRGSARTMAGELSKGVRVRRDGRLTTVRPGALERGFNFGEGGRACTAVSWGDVATAYYTTGVSDVEVYFDATPTVRSTLIASRAFGPALGTSAWQTWLKTMVELLPDGPSASERRRRRASIVAEASNDENRRAVARLRLPEAYTFTAIAGAAITARVLRGDAEPGFQTPGRLFGPDFVLELPDVTREDLDEA